VSYKPPNECRPRLRSLPPPDGVIGRVYRIGRRAPSPFGMVALFVALQRSPPAE